jgi:DNA-directed RNA polymerase subunit K/omega
MIEQLEKQFSRYEIARILGARALQIAMDAPLLIKIDQKELEEINYNPLEIAKRELVSGVLPITVNRPLPKKKEAKIVKLSKEEIDAIKKKEEAKIAEELSVSGKKAEVKEDEKLETEEVEEEKKVAEDAEIMELSTPEDESEETSESSTEEEI